MRNQRNHPHHLHYLFVLSVFNACVGGGQAESSTRPSLTLESRHPYVLHGPARDLVVLADQIVAIEDRSSQLVWLDAAGIETTRSDELFAGVAHIDGRIYAYDRQAVFHIPEAGRVELCPMQGALGHVEDLIPSRDGAWVLHVAEGLRLLSRFRCDRITAPAETLAVPIDALLSFHDDEFLGVGVRSPFDIWSISLSGSTQRLGTLAQQSSVLRAGRLFLQGATSLGERGLLLLFTELSSLQRHLMVISSKGKIVSESTLNAPVGLLGVAEDKSLVYFNLSRPSGGEVLIYGSH